MVMPGQCTPTSSVQGPLRCEGAAVRRSQTEALRQANFAFGGARPADAVLLGAHSSVYKLGVKVPATRIPDTSCPRSLPPRSAGKPTRIARLVTCLADERRR
jgi:hypothetical protein